MCRVWRSVVEFFVWAQAVESRRWPDVLNVGHSQYNFWAKHIIYPPLNDRGPCHVHQGTTYTFRDAVLLLRVGC